MSEEAAKYDVATQDEQFGLITKQAQVSMFLNEQRFEFAQRIGKMLSASTMIPEHFRNNLGNCMIALNLSERLGIDVFGLMQTSYVVHGRPGFEAKLLIAVFNSRTKLFFPPLRWEMKGDFPKGQDAACRAFAVDKETREPLYGEWIDWEMVRGEGWLDKAGSKWKTIPGQMFRYRAASFFINVYEPGLKMGIQTVDELEESIIDITPRPSLKIEGDKEAEPGKDPYEVKPIQKEEPVTVETVAPETMDEKALYREEWVNLRSAGYSTFIHKNFKRIEDNGRRWPDLYQEMKEKWAKLYKEVWPLVEKVQGNLAPIDQGERVETDTLSDADKAFIVEVEEYKEALDEKDFSTILAFYGVAKKPVTELEDESRERFLGQLKKALDKQNSDR